MHCLALLLLVFLGSVHGSGQVVQFLVHANEKSDITRLFPGAYVDFTWNSIWIVSIWTSETVALTKSIQETLAENTNVVQVLVPPYTLDVSTQNWIKFNGVWVAMLLLVFTAGCVCGAGLAVQCFNARKAIYRNGDRY